MSPSEGEAREASFDAFVFDASERLLRAAAVMMADRRRDAEDVVQETLIILYRRWPHIKDKAAAYSYAHQTMARLVWRYMKRSRRQFAGGGLDRETANIPEDGHAIHFDVVAAVQALPIRQRQTVVLRFLEDFSVADTARILKCTESTVKSQTRDATEHLRRLLVDVDVDVDVDR